MSYTYPEKVILTGGREIGGLESFAQSLSEGFQSLGLKAEVVSPTEVLRHPRILRSRNTLKILSTTALFGAPLARRSICVLHGFPRADAQGWGKFIALVGAYKLAGSCSGTRVVAVSHYTRIHVQTIFDVPCAGTIGNPLHPGFFEKFDSMRTGRSYITYIGRMISAKNVMSLLPAVERVLEEQADMRAVFAGDGPLREVIAARTQANPRIEVPGAISMDTVRDYLRQTKVFVSGCETEALGIAYLEALSQGCAVAMPASGGGLEIAPNLVGEQVHLFSPSLDCQSIYESLTRALQCTDSTPLDLSDYSPSSVARKYLDVDRMFFEDEMRHADSLRTSEANER